MVQDCCPINSFPSGPHDLFVGLELLQHKVAMSHRRGGEKLQAQVPAVISVPWIKLREQMRYHGIEMLGINLKHIKVKTVNECNYKIIVKFNIYIYIHILYLNSLHTKHIMALQRKRARQRDPLTSNPKAMYTFGAPAVSNPAMPDLNQPDHCFRGLRTYTDTWTA